MVAHCVLFARVCVWAGKSCLAALDGHTTAANGVRTVCGGSRVHTTPAQLRLMKTSLSRCNPKFGRYGLANSRASVVQYWNPVFLGVSESPPAGQGTESGFAHRDVGSMHARGWNTPVNFSTSMDLFQCRGATAIVWCNAVS